MGERGVRNAEVTGSIPVPSTGRADRIFLALALLLAFGPTGATGQTEPPEVSLASLIGRIERHHRSLPHFRARFEQQFTPRIFGRSRTETGQLIVKRPDRMRWEYETPEPKVFVTDGTNTWFHVPADRQVVVGAFRSAGGSGDTNATPAELATGEVNPLGFLTGELDLLDHFDVELEEPGSGGFRPLRLTPHEPAAVSFVRLLVEPDAGLIRGLEWEDPEGNVTRFRFDDFRTDEPPEDSTFVFLIPPGTEILTASDFRGPGDRP